MYDIILYYLLIIERFRYDVVSAVRSILIRFPKIVILNLGINIFPNSHQS